MAEKWGPQRRGGARFLRLLVSGGCLAGALALLSSPGGLGPQGQCEMDAPDLNSLMDTCIVLSPHGAM